MRIGILGHSFIEWTGGFDFIRNLIDSLLAVELDLEIHLLLPVGGPIGRIRQLLRRLRGIVRPTRTVCPNPEMVLADCVDLDKLVCISVIDVGAAALMRYCAQNKIDVLLPALQCLPPAITVPWIGYIADFQHKHLPDYFTKKDRALRDVHFAKMLRTADAVIVNSASVAGDAIQFYPDLSSRIFPLPFSGAYPRVEPTAAEVVRNIYSISGRFFMICNQFWCHKDHATAFRAYSEVTRLEQGVALVCTGNLSDPRDPSHIQRLLQLAKDLGVYEKIRLLGVIPKSHQLGLMAECLAVIQPTLCEGGPGGGSVFESVGLGVRSIVSDIPVNLEIDEPTVRHFKTGDYRDLATKMHEALHDRSIPASKDVLRIEGHLRRRACGLTLIQAIKYVQRVAT